MNDNTKLTFIKEDPWRIFRIMAEFVDSFETLSQVGPGVTVFGSARIKPTEPAYKATVELARQLARHNRMERWGDKTPEYIHHLPVLQAVFPDVAVERV